MMEDEYDEWAEPSEPNRNLTGVEYLVGDTIKRLVKDFFKKELNTILDEKIETSLRKLLKEGRQKREAELSERTDLTQKELIEYTGKTKATINRWEKEGLITGKKVGRFKMYPRSTLDLLKAKLGEYHRPRINS